MRLSRQTVVITGAGGGIGRALAAAFAAEGAAVALGDLGDAAKPVAELIERSGRGAVAVRADIASSGDMARLADAALARFGRLDALVTCAGVDGSARMAEQDEAAWTRVIDVNPNGLPRHPCRAAGDDAAANRPDRDDGVDPGPLRRVAS